MLTSKAKANATVPHRYWTNPGVKLSYFTKAANEEHDPLEEDAWNLLAVQDKSKISVEFDDRGESSNNFLPVHSQFLFKTSPRASSLCQNP